MWIWIAVVVLALLVLGAVSVPLLGKLSGLQRAVRRLQLRQAEVTKVQQGAARLESTLLGLQERAETMRERTFTAR
jgi:Sec-independent protein translocase protein TatA